MVDKKGSMQEGKGTKRGRVRIPSGGTRKMGTWANDPAIGIGMYIGWS